MIVVYLRKFFNLFLALAVSLGMSDAFAAPISQTVKRSAGAISTPSSTKSSDKFKYELTGWDTDLTIVSNGDTVTARFDSRQPNIFGGDNLDGFVKTIGEVWIPEHFPGAKYINVEGWDQNSGTLIFKGSAKAPDWKLQVVSRSGVLASGTLGATLSDFLKKPALDSKPTPVLGRLAMADFLGEWETRTNDNIAVVHYFPDYTLAMYNSPLGAQSINFSESIGLRWNVVNKQGASYLIFNAGDHTDAMPIVAFDQRQFTYEYEGSQSTVTKTNRDYCQMLVDYYKQLETIMTWPDRYYPNYRLMMEEFKSINGFARANNYFNSRLSGDGRDLAEGAVEGEIHKRVVRIFIAFSLPELALFIETVDRVIQVLDIVANAKENIKTWSHLYNYDQSHNMKERARINKLKWNVWKNELHQMQTVHQDIKQRVDQAGCMRFDINKGSYPHNTGMPGLPIEYIYETKPK